MEPWSHQRKCCDHQSRNVGGPQKLEESVAISEGIKVLTDTLLSSSETVFGLTVSRTVEKNECPVVLRHQVCDNLFQYHQETKIYSEMPS